MHTTSSTLLLVFAACLAACSPATPDTAMRTVAVAPAPPALPTACPPAGDGRFTSKMRHVPNEDDPCADTRGVRQH